MFVFVRRRSGLAVPAVLGLVGSLLAVSAAPSGAAGDGKPSNAAVYSACVAAAMSDAGFVDMDGGHAKAAADCLAHYGITTGTAPGMYSPSASVTRAQMAVFLARAAGPAGLDLGAATDQGFSDIGGYSMTFRDAINRVAKAGIMSATSMGMFSPDALVSRADMAVFLDGFVGKARIGPGGLGGASKYADVKPDDDPFTDLGGVPFGAYGSIRRVYELGIAAGTGNKMFSPDASVTRNQMALFITRALAHTNARPAGLSVQADRSRTNNSTSGGFMLHAAHRGADHMPVVNSRLDTFSASASAAFDQDGLCKTLKSGVTDPAASSSRCVIDTGDEMTDSDGNVVSEVTNTSAYCPGAKRVWAWTGAADARFDNDSTTAAFVDVGVSKTHRSFRFFSDMKKHATHVPFGRSVNITLQLVTGLIGTGDPVAWKDVEATVRFVQTGPGTNTRTVVQKHKTDAAGRIELTFSHDDPDPGSVGQTVRAVVTVTAAIRVRSGAAVSSPPTGGGSTPPPPPGGRPQLANNVEIGDVTWTDDAAPVAKTLTIANVPSNYKLASAEGPGVRNTVETQLFDNFGDPVRGVEVHFWSDGNNGNASTDDNGLGGKAGVDAAGSVKAPSGQGHLGSTDNFGATVRTNSRGIARYSYFRDSAAHFQETIGAVAQIGLRDGAAGTRAAESNDVYFQDGDPSDTQWDRLSHFWAKQATSTTTITNFLAATAIDKAANEFVLVNTSNQELWLVKYDSNDHFNVPVPSGSSSQSAISMEIFERLIRDGDRYTVMLAADPGPGVNTFTMLSNGYTPPNPCHN